jgi:hypothetical protein
VFREEAEGPDCWSAEGHFGDVLLLKGAERVEEIDDGLIISMMRSLRACPKSGEACMFGNATPLLDMLTNSSRYCRIAVSEYILVGSGISIC